MSCDCDTRTANLLSYEDALSKLLNEATPVSQTEQVQLVDALDRVLSKDVLSPMKVPPFNNSGMDGYAIRIQDLKNHSTLTIQDPIFAGDFYKKDIPIGHCVRIMTGACVPAQMDTVVMQEDTEVTDNKLTIHSKCQPNQNIRYAGEDIDLDETVVESGRKICPTDIGLLASLGILKVTVKRRLKVAILSTGDELVKPGRKLEEGQIYESNSAVVTAMLKRLNMETVNLGIIPDIPELIEKAFIEADSVADVVISSGGVSVGDADYVKDVLCALGSIDFWKVAIKPGKPFAFGKLKSSYFIGLPGNPVSSTITFNKLAKPFLNKLSGASKPLPEICIPAIARKPFKKKPGRLDFQRAVIFKNEKNEWCVEPAGTQGSGILSSMSKAMGFVNIPANSGTVMAGKYVDFYPYDDSLSVLI